MANGWKRACAVVAAMSVTAGSAMAAAPDFMSIVVPQSQILNGEADIGAFAYDPTSGDFWVALFSGGTGIRHIDPNVSNEFYATDTNFLQFFFSSDPTAGVTNIQDYSTTSTLTSAVQLNPAAITIDYGDELDANGNPIGEVTYQPGELAYIVEAANEILHPASGTYYPERTKRIFTFDLREVGSSDTSVGVPDRNNAQNGSSTPTVIGAYNTVDWNDVFHPLVSEQDIREAAGSTSTGVNGTNFGRQVSFSSDGQYLYAADTSTGNGTAGIYKINAATGEVVQIHNQTQIAETAVMHTSVRELVAGSGSGDQIIIQGNSSNGNAGGLSMLLDDGTPGLKNATTVISGAEATALLGGTMSASFIDVLGKDIYYYDGSRGGLFRYDEHGRIVALAVRAHMTALNQTEDGVYGDSGGMVRLQVYNEGGQINVYYRADNKHIAKVAVSAFQPGDFDKDGNYDAADTAFFITQFNRTTQPGAADADYFTYLTADLAGSGSNVNSSTGALTNDAVDRYDLNVLRQFINLRDGDTDWNFKVDLADYVTLKNNFNPTATDKTFFQGNFDYNDDGNVDLGDYLALKANFNPTYEYEHDALLADVLPTVSPLDVPAGELLLRIFLDGNAELEGNNTTFDGIQIVGTAETILEVNFSDIPGHEEIVGDDFLAAITAGSGYTLTGTLAIGQIYNNLGLNGADLQFSYGSGGSLVVGNIEFVVPEPASLGLLALGGLVLAGRRRR